jgi:uncharacterized protein (TIGR00251 family)
MSDPWFRWEGEDLVLQLKVQPKASRDEFATPHGDRFRVRITAPPVDGKANDHLTRFLAKSFGVPRGSVSLLRGESSRDKTFRIQTPKKIPAEMTAAGES